MSDLDKYKALCVKCPVIELVNDQITRNKARSESLDTRESELKQRETELDERINSDTEVK